MTELYNNSRFRKTGMLDGLGEGGVFPVDSLSSFFQNISVEALLPLGGFNSEGQKAGDGVYSYKLRVKEAHGVQSKLGEPAWKPTFCSF